jgi:formate dehydrogenase subunit delta
MMTPHERLIYMANQIARNFATQGEEKAALATADHIKAFWDPRMKAEIFTVATGLDPVAERAIALLRDHLATPHQSAATAEQGGSDAG